MIWGINQGQILPCIDSLGSNELEAAFPCHLWCQRSRKLCWQCFCGQIYFQRFTPSSPFCYFFVWAFFLHMWWIPLYSCTTMDLILYNSLESHKVEFNNQFGRSTQKAIDIVTLLFEDPESQFGFESELFCDHLDGCVQDLWCSRQPIFCSFPLTGLDCNGPSFWDTPWISFTQNLPQLIRSKWDRLDDLEYWTDICQCMCREKDQKKTKMTGLVCHKEEREMR